jgi:FtsH-binding integral membrane protein
MDLLKRIISIVAIGAVGVAGVALLVSWWQMTPDERAAAYGLVGRAVAWILVAGVLPWATWFFTSHAVKRESNTAGAVLIGLYTVIDIVLLGWVAKWTMPSGVSAVVCLFGVLAALAYNFLICDWLAERV